MNLKKALEKLDRELDSIPDLSIATLRQVLRCVLEALAEPEEGKETIKTSLGELRTDAEKVFAIEEIIEKCSQPDTPALYFGDLVEKEDGTRAIFQRHLGHSKMCWVLKVDPSGDLVDRHWNVEGLKLIQRDYCKFRLGMIRDKLRSKG